MHGSQAAPTWGSGRGGLTRIERSHGGRPTVRGPQTPCSATRFAAVGLGRPCVGCRRHARPPGSQPSVPADRAWAADAVLGHPVRSRRPRPTVRGLQTPCLATRFAAFIPGRPCVGCRRHAWPPGSQPSSPADRARAADAVLGHPVHSRRLRLTVRGPHTGVLDGNPIVGDPGTSDAGPQRQGAAAEISLPAADPSCAAPSRRSATYAGRRSPGPGRRRAADCCRPRARSSRARRASGRVRSRDRWR